MNKKIFILLLFTALYGFLYESENINVGYLYFEKSQNINSGVPFNYFLINRKNNEVVSFLVNDVFSDRDYIYFSYIDGKLDHDFCYKNPDLKLARINRYTHRIETLPSHYDERIFGLISNIEQTDMEWLSQKSNQCK